MVMIIKKISIRPILAMCNTHSRQVEFRKHALTPTEVQIMPSCVCNIPSESNLSSSCITIEY